MCALTCVCLCVCLCGEGQVTASESCRAYWGRSGLPAVVRDTARCCFVTLSSLCVAVQVVQKGLHEDPLARARPVRAVIVCLTTCATLLLRRGRSQNAKVILSRLSKILIKRFNASIQYDVISAHCLHEEQSSDINQSIRFLTAFPIAGD